MSGIVVSRALVVLVLGPAAVGQSPPLDPLRAALAEQGVAVGVSMLADWSVVARGGARSGHGVLRALWDVDVDVDCGRALGVDGLRFDVGGQLQRGRDGSLDSGDFQVYSNIDGPDRLQVARLFFEQRCCGDGLRCKIGKFDANDDFALVDNGLLHLHSSPGFAPTIVGFPSYPDPAFGAALFAECDCGLFARGAVFDGATQVGVATGPRGPRTVFDSPSAWFLVGEGGVRWGHGDVACGAFRHTGTFEGRSGEPVDGLSGLYANWEQHLPCCGDGGAGDAGGLRVFAQYGWVDPDGSVLEHYHGVGATWTGLGSARPRDVLGLGANWVRWRDRPGGGVRGGGEFVVECFLRAQLSPSIALVPDVQWIHDPGGRPELADALVLTLRLDVLF